MRAMLCRQFPMFAGKPVDDRPYHGASCTRLRHGNAAGITRVGFTPLIRGDAAIQMGVEISSVTAICTATKTVRLPNLGYLLQRSMGKAFSKGSGLNSIGGSPPMSIASDTERAAWYSGRPVPA